ncbi:hypothetical protein ABIE50_003157 [Chitinophaga sp. OAE865]
MIPVKEKGNFHLSKWYLDEQQKVAHTTLPQKGLRKVTIGTNRYAWNVTGNDAMAF